MTNNQQLNSSIQSLLFHCSNGSLPFSFRSGNPEVFIFPGFPVVNSPLLVRFYVRLQVNSSVSVVLERTVLTSILDRVLENLTAEFGVQFSG